MIPQDKNQPGPPGVVKTFGHPWHGLVEDGTLTLPNDATMPYPAPTGAGEADVLAFRVPGTPPVTRTPEQAAADAAAGRQWLDYALISGRYTRRLYGRTIGGNGTWLYAAPDGSRWLVTLADVPGTHDLTSAWTATLTCVRFGEIGGTPETHTLTATLSDWQQDIPGHPGGDYNIDGHVLGAATFASVSVNDVRDDGSQAIMMISINAGDEIFDLNNPLLERPIGFLTCTLSGTPGDDAVAVLAVARSRAATLGTRFLSNSGSLSDWYHNQFLGTWDQDYNDESDNMIARVGSESFSGGISGRILAMIYSAGDNLSEITLSTSFSWESNNPLPPNGVETLTGSSSSTSSGSVMLSGPYGSATIVMSQDVVRSYVYDSTDAELGSYYVTVTTNTDMTTNIGADVVSSTSSYIDRQSNGLLFVGGLGGESFGLDPGDDGFDCDLSVLHTDNNLGAGTVTTRAFMVTRYSAVALDLTLAIHVQHPPSGPSAFEEFRYLGAVGPGSGGGAISVPTPHPFGSAHPVTGEIARARDVPVCWV